MTTHVKNSLKEIKKGLSQLYGKRLRGLVLYGSYARGDNREGSDLDILVILNEFERSPIELDRTEDLMSELSLKYLITISPLFMREKDWLTADKPLLRNVRAEGVPI